MFNFEFWDKEWLVITGAPYVVIAIIAVAAFVIVSWVHLRESAGRNAEIAARVAENAALTERLRLAAYEQELVTREVDRLKSETAALTQQINLQTPLPELATTVARVTSTTLRLSEKNTVLGSTLTRGGARLGKLAVDTKVTRKSYE